MRALALFPLLLWGCDDHLFPRPGGGEYTPDWAGTQQLMADHCQECHPSILPPDIPSDIEADILDGTGRWIVPGDPRASELYLVMVDQSLVGTSAMPSGGEQLPEQNTEAVREWIRNGALLE